MTYFNVIDNLHILRLNQGSQLAPSTKQEEFSLMKHKYFVAFTIKRAGGGPLYPVNGVTTRKKPIVLNSTADKLKLEKSLYERHFNRNERQAGDLCTLVSIQRLPLQ